MVGDFFDVDGGMSQRQGGHTADGGSAETENRERIRNVDLTTVAFVQ